MNSTQSKIVRSMRILPNPIAASESGHCNGRYSNRLPWEWPGSLCRAPANNRRGAALLMSLFVLCFVSVVLVHILDTETIQFSAHRNAVDYERAVYLAGAAIHHATTQLEMNPTWRGSVTDGSFPADNTYQATVEDSVGNTVLITGVGVAGETTRRLQATVVQSY